MEKTPALGTSEYTNYLVDKGAALGMDLSQFKVGPMTPESLGSSATPVKLPPAPTGPATYGDITNEATAMSEAIKLRQTEEAKATEAETANKGYLTKIEDLAEKYLGIQKSVGDEEAKAKIPEKSQALVTAQNALEQSQRNQTNELRALDSQVLSPEGKAQAASAINRKYAFEQADLALSASFALRDFEAAQRIVDRKIELQLEPLKNEMEFVKFFYQENKSQLTSAQDKAFNLRLKEIDNALSKAREMQTAIGNLQLKALERGIVIPSSVLTQLNGAQNLSEAASILSKNGISLKEPESGGSNVSITPEDRRILTGAGFLPAEINDVVRAVRDFGIDAVLAEYSDEKKKAAIKKIFNVASTVTRAQIDTQVDLAMKKGEIDVVDVIENNMTEDQLKEAIKDAGYRSIWQKRSTERTKFLESEDGKALAKKLYADLLEEQYRAAGMFE